MNRTPITVKELQLLLVQSNGKRIARLTTQIKEMQDEITELTQRRERESLTMEFKPIAVAIYNRIESLCNLLEETKETYGYKEYGNIYSTEVANFESLCVHTESYTEEEATEFMDAIQEYCEYIGGAE